MTRDLLNLNLLAKLMVLHQQILFSLASAAIAESVLMRTSEKVASLYRVAPRSGSFLCYFHSVCLCSVCESVGKVVLKLPPIRSMSLVNQRLHMYLPPMGMDVWWSWIVSCMFFSRNK